MATPRHGLVCSRSLGSEVVAVRAEVVATVFERAALQAGLDPGVVVIIESVGVNKREGSDCHGSYCDRGV